MKNNLMCELECPECGKMLSVNVMRCRCGWKKITASAPLAPKDYRCEYIINTQRCPLPGTLCSYPHSAGPWYCAAHWHARGDPKLGETIFLHAEKFVKTGCQKIGFNS
jgi:hypothetical protein